MTYINLDDLLTESLQEASERNTAREGRKALAEGRVSPEERAQVSRIVRTWEEKREWTPAAAVVMFSRQMCAGCGSFHKHFLGFFQRQTHRASRVDRWIPHTKPTDTVLPREAKYQDSVVECCEDCAEALGFEVEE